MEARPCSSSQPTMETAEPRAHTCSPAKWRSRPANCRAMAIVLLPLREPITEATAYLDGISRQMWTWSGIRGSVANYRKQESLVSQVIDFSTHDFHVWPQKRKFVTELLQQYTPRAVYPYPPLGCVPHLGVGHRGWRAGAGLGETLRLGHGAERPHPSNSAKGRRADHLSHGDVHGIPTASAWAAPSPGPLHVPADQLHQVLGIRDVRYVQGQHALALVEAPLG